MPQALAAWLATYIGSTIAAEAIANIVVAVLVNVALMKIEQLLAPNGNTTGNPPAINVTTRSTVAFRRIVFGTVRCGGALVFYRTSGTSHQYLWYVVAYAGHQCYAVGDAYLDSAQILAIQIDATTGAVTASNFNNKLYIATHLGTSSQTTDSWLNADFSTLWDSNDRLRGVCYRVFRLERDDKAWPNGPPQSLSSVVSGALLYDPRKDSTNGGSGSHRRNDATTWEFSRNAALAARWFLSGGSVTNDVATPLVKYGLREVSARIDDSYTIASANICDESISGPNAPPGGAEARYECSIEIGCEQRRRDILTELLSTMGPGQLVYVHGKWRLYSAAYDAPVHDFDQDDLHGEMQIQDTNSATDRYNAVCATYVDKSQGYVDATSIFRTQAAYETQDGGERIEKTLPLRGVTSPYQAQRICELVMRGSRYMRTVKFPLQRKGMVVANWETFTFSHSRYGWTDRVFRCVQRELQYQDDGAVIAVITAKQDDAAVYTDILTADYTTGTSITSAIQSELPDTPLSLTAVAIGGQNIRFSWTLASFWQLNGVSELWEYTSATPFSSATLVWMGRGTQAVLTRDDTVTRYYWVRIRTVGGQVSATYPAVNGVSAQASQVGTPDIEDEAASQTLTVGSHSSSTLSIFANGVHGSLVLQQAYFTCHGDAVSIDCEVDVVLSGGDDSRWTEAKVMVCRGGTGLEQNATAIVGQTFDLLAAFRAPANSPVSLRLPITMTCDEVPPAGANLYSFIVAVNTTSVGGSPLLGGLNTGDSAMKIREYKK